MPTGIYKHEKHTKERCQNISRALKGKPKSAETRAKMKAHQQGENHNSFKGDNIAKITCHIWVAKRKPKPKCRLFCGKERKLNLANIKKHKHTRNDRKNINSKK